ncbi:MAG: hypothetical protein AAFX44_09950 [Pseudomonadota bacterium]
MNRLFTSATLSVVGLLVSLAACAAEKLPLPKSASVLEFADARTLFVADSVGGRIFAYTLDGIPNTSEATDSTAFNVLGLGQKLGAALEVSPFAITYNDLAVHPVTRHAFVSLTVKGAKAPMPAIAKVDLEGNVIVLDLERLEGTSIALDDKPDDGVSFWRDLPASTFTVTDLDFADGELFVAGLSSGEFASTLRRVAFPFESEYASTRIEMFHTAHDQNETRAPIRAMAVTKLNGELTVVAAYTCTPLVTVPVAGLKDGERVTGKTIAELGYGNTPLEVITFSAMNMEQKREDFVLVINREMDADLISFDALTAAATAEGLNEPVPYLGATSGVPTTPLPLSGVAQAADQDIQFLLTLKRNLDTGDMDLVSYRKGSYMRLSDFVSEYNFPDYAYVEKQDGARMFQNLLKMDEGYPDLVR